MLTRLLALVILFVTASAATASERALPPLGKRCGSPGVRASVFRFPASDGTVLDGAVLGHGSAGVVLAHQAYENLCQWVPFGRVLAGKGYRVLVFDFRGAGLSASGAPHQGNLNTDVSAAAAERRRGATSVVLVGASLGGSAVVSAAPDVRPRVAAVVSLSAPGTASLRGFSSTYAPLDPDRGAARLRAPVLFAAAKGDSVLPADAKRFYRLTRAPVKKLLIVPGSAHGVNLLDTATESVVLRFIRANT